MLHWNHDIFTDSHDFWDHQYERFVSIMGPLMAQVCTIFWTGKDQMRMISGYQNVSDAVRLLKILKSIYREKQTLY